eukprot:TRINITY_DN21925_c0_g2_i2.p1 TRINITY_DN21925_c0_g2~~TRINITY_DN21925_c0_g2_i2.p1  ORF type:complete len:285 (+),score=15.18 TRINITY_DN21925_c0_g2_i2:98-952(+)
MATTTLSQNELILDLLRLEESAFMRMPSISTLTYFLGLAPVDGLAKRVGEVVRANPWLCGRLVSANGRVRVTFPERPDVRNFKRCFHHRRLDVIPRIEEGHTAFQREVASFCVRSGGSCVDSDAPLFRVVLFSDEKNECREGDRSASFAILTSMSHVLGDAHTYYAVISMLSDSEETRTLESQRHIRFDKELETALGHSEAWWIAGSGFYASACGNYMWRSTVSTCLLEVFPPAAHVIFVKRGFERRPLLMIRRRPADWVGPGSQRAMLADRPYKFVPRSARNC